MQPKLVVFFTASLVLSFAQNSNAHFPWLVMTEDGRAAYFFGESIADRTYKLPPSIKQAEIRLVDSDGNVNTIPLQPIETAEFVGMTSTSPVAKDANLISAVTFGVYHGSKLNYYTQHHGGKLLTNFDASKIKLVPLDLQAQAIDTETGVDIYVIWQQQAS